VVSFPDLDEPLRDGPIELRFGAERDIPEILIAHQDDPEMYKRLGEERPPSGAELGRYAEAADGERAAGSYVALTIVEAGRGDCVGRIAVHTVEPEAARAELGVWLTPQVRGRGYAARALALAAGWLFGRCGVERLAVLTETDNEPMIRAAEAAGFEREGVLRQYTRERGARVDALSMSLLRSDLGA
jgi:RimJ/RimL family protein N-acetyltransferase